MSAAGEGVHWGGGGGGNDERRFLAARGSYGLNDVKGWGMGGEVRGADVDWNHSSHHKYKAPKQFL